ncbi:hypothetical protein ACFWMR_04325 [Amycolatopsis thailandensis]|uniref:hypothetical protein n=1 Tax=Amycolatopsis thailandensis TaxID=589330 RepID=UPI00366A4A7A
MTIAEDTDRAPEFASRAAQARIRAADAGVVHAAEFIWLLDHLPSSMAVPAPRQSHVGTS